MPSSFSHGMHSVIIIGGGPVGLLMSIALSQQNIPHVLFEKHAATCIHPKSVGINQRTMEYLRILGLEDEIVEIRAPAHCISRTSWYTFLGPGGQEITSRYAWGGGPYQEEYEEASPCQYTILPQIRLEPLLHRKANELNPGGIVNDAKVVGILEEEDSVRVEILYEGGTVTVEALFVIGADGGRMTAEALGIGYQGERDILQMVSAHIKAPISQFHPDSQSLISWFIDPRFGGTIGSGTLYHLGPYPMHSDTEEWLYNCSLPTSEWKKFGPQEMTARIHRALRIPDLSLDIMSLSHWSVNAEVADKYRSTGGRVFLVGDAAHRTPPWGALGLNTGFQDVQNLSWKLAMVLKARTIKEQLEFDTFLDTYEAERRPIALQVAETTSGNLKKHALFMDRALGIYVEAPVVDNVRRFESYFDLDNPYGAQFRAAVEEAKRVLDSEFHAHGIEMGWFYPSLDIEGEGLRDRHGGQLGEDGEFNITRYYPSAIPGHHLPHLWLDKEKKHVSTRDLFRTDKCILLSITADPWSELGGPWVQATILNEGVDRYRERDVKFVALCGLDLDGAVLVRPDGIVLARFSSARDSMSKEFLDNPQAFISERMKLPLGV